MIIVAERVVFDCNVFVQALISPTGPAAACFDAAGKSQILLFFSQYVLAEVKEVALRDHFVSRFGLSTTMVDSFIKKIESIGVFVEDVPHVFQYERDPKDEHYVDLAIATGSCLLVSRDTDLLALADKTSTEGAAFQ